MTYHYIREPQAIYDESFRQIALLLADYQLDEAIKPLASRMVHACGIPQIVPQIDYSADFVEKAKGALNRIFVDVMMLKAGIIQRILPANAQILCSLDQPQVPELARKLGTTRSAAALELWPQINGKDQDALEGALVVIGNAPTALFHLLEGIEQGRFSKPAAIIGIPVGFVGAQESKVALAQSGLTYLTLHGKIGGSAIAAAAVNALA